MRNKDFEKKYGFLVRGLKVERIKGAERVQNAFAILVYPLFLFYRLIYSMIPAIFFNHPGLQIVALISITFVYIGI